VLFLNDAEEVTRDFLQVSKFNKYLQIGSESFYFWKNFGMWSNPPTSIFIAQNFRYFQILCHLIEDSLTQPTIYLSHLSTFDFQKIFPKPPQLFSFILSLIEKLSNFFKFLFFELAYDLREQAFTLILVQLSWLPRVDFSRYGFKTWLRFSLTTNFTQKDQKFFFFKFPNLMSFDRDGCRKISDESQMMRSLLIHEKLFFKFSLSLGFPCLSPLSNKIWKNIFICIFQNHTSSEKKKVRFYGWSNPENCLIPGFGDSYFFNYKKFIGQLFPQSQKW